MKPEDYIREVLERCEKATPGKWEAMGDSIFGTYSYIRQEKSHWRITETTKNKDHVNNSLFIAHSRTDVEKLARYCIALREALLFYAMGPILFDKSSKSTCMISKFQLGESEIDIRDPAREALEKEID